MIRRNPIRARASMLKHAQAVLTATTWSQGVAGRCEGARPSQIRAGAKTISYRPDVAKILHSQKAA